MKPEGSLPCSQEPATGPYRKQGPDGHCLGLFFVFTIIFHNRKDSSIQFISYFTQVFGYRKTQGIFYQLSDYQLNKRDSCYID
jgi:hypothetical protein